jgi:plasmid stabilization system protein ParE
MKYRIEVSSVAEAEADKVFLDMAQRTSLETARYWQASLLSAIESLVQMPKRCSLARENQYFSQEIRQLIHGKGRNVYRILFTVLEGEDVSIVRILHIRHAAQLPVGEPKERSDEM